MPQLKPRLTVRAIRPLVSGLRECGYDAAPILAAVGIDDSMLNDPGDTVTLTGTLTGESIRVAKVEMAGTSKDRR